MFVRAAPRPLAVKPPVLCAPCGNAVTEATNAQPGKGERHPHRGLTAVLMCGRVKADVGEGRKPAGLIA